MRLLLDETVLIELVGERQPYCACWNKLAALQLTQESVSLTTAAMNAGFESMRTFYRSFKRVFGVSPSEYLKKNGGRPSRDMLHNPFYLSGGTLPP